MKKNIPWTINSWKNCSIKHIPKYSDLKLLNETTDKLKNFPPLVFAGEVRILKEKLAKINQGEGFLLQCGDCAESFDEFNANNIRDTFRVILQMSIILAAGIQQPITKVGRMAGQFAKPRTNSKEVKNGIELPSYFGDSINDISFELNKRLPNPKRMLKAYSQSASTLNLLRAFSDGGYGDLNRVQSWNMSFVKKDKQVERYKYLADSIQENLNFMKAFDITSKNTPQLSKVDFYTSHEALLLPYEEALTRQDSITNDIYDTSAHLLWIGDRTRFVNSAHVEFCRGIRNPLGIKCGPSLKPKELVEIIKILNPKNELGKIILITRYGHDKVDKFLPLLIKEVNKNGFNVIWSCDPMHGNTIKSNLGIKTRPFEKILEEVKKTIQIHESEENRLGGIHLEMTGQNVTECIGGSNEVLESQLTDRYRTHCDPRLNANQSLELAFLIADELKKIK
mgnify:FL=1